MNIRQFQKFKYLRFVGLFLIAANLSANELDLTALPKNQVRGELQNILPKLCAGLELPCILLSRPFTPGVLISARYNCPDLLASPSNLAGLPTCGMAVGATPDLIIAGQIGTGRWQEETLNSMGIYLAYVWGKPTAPNQIIGGVNHTKGPVDFHFLDMSLGYLKLFQFNQWLFSVAGTAHFTQVGIHVTDNLNSTDNYKARKNIDFMLVNITLQRNLGEHFQIGTNLTFSPKSVSGGIALGSYF